MPKAIPNGIEAGKRTSENEMIGRLNHVAIAVPDLVAAADQYRNALGAKVGDPQDEPDHGVTVVFIELENTKIELLYPLGDASPIQGFLDKNPCVLTMHLGPDEAIFDPPLLGGQVARNFFARELLPFTTKRSAVSEFETNGKVGFVNSFPSSSSSSHSNNLYRFGVIAMRITAIKKKGYDI